MEIPGFFFNQVAEFDPLLYPQDAAGGEIPTPTIAAILIPCCVQQDSGPTVIGADGQKRRGSEAGLKVFLRPGDPSGLRVMQKLKANDRIQVRGRAFPIVLDGPPFDASGRGVVWEAKGRDIR